MDTETDFDLKKLFDSIDDVSDNKNACKGSTKSDSDSKIKKKTSSRRKKNCRVCGQQSLSHNFGVIACESCKIFFRRHGMKNLENLICFKENKCEINIKTRKYCMKCRIRKCLQIGMKFDQVMSRKHSGNMHPSVCGPDLSIWHHATQVDDPDVNINQESSNCTQISATSTTMIGSSWVQISHQNSIHFGYTNQEMISEADTEDTDCIIITENGSSRVPEKKRWRIEDDTTTKLDKTDRKEIHWQDELIAINSELPVLSSEIVELEFTGLRMEELYLANEVWNSRQTKSAPPLNGNCAWNITYADFMHVFHHTFTNIIKQHRQLGVFHSINQEDQMILLKGRLIALCKIRFVFKSCGPNDLTDIQYPGAPGGVNMDWSKRVKGNSYDQQLILKNSLPDKFKCNQTLMLLLSAIVLFDPSHVELIDKNDVEHGREIYLKLFKSYLDSTYGSTEAPTAYKTLLSWLGHLICFIKNCSSGGILELNPRNFEVMTMAAFDFK